jgi:hypothetical protein
MQVKTQPFKEALELKGDGICFDIYGNGSKRLGDLAITRGGLVWNKVAGGKPMRGQGINVRWEEFINWVQSRRANGGNGGMMKLSSQKGKPQAQGAARSGAAQKIGAKSASGLKTGTLSGSAQKIGMGASTHKTGATGSAGQKTGAKAASPMKSASSMKGASSMKTAASTKSASPLKIGAKTIPSLKIGSKSASSVKPASKTGAAVKSASKTAGTSRPAMGAGKPSAQNGAPAKLPATRLPQSQAKGKTAGMAASKAASAGRTAGAARGRKAN